MTVITSLCKVSRLRDCVICMCARDHVSTLIVSELSLVHNTTLAHRFVSYCPSVEL